jgi:hypothetical protein
MVVDGHCGDAGGALLHLAVLYDKAQRELMANAVERKVTIPMPPICHRESSFLFCFSGQSHNCIVGAGRPVFSGASAPDFRGAGIYLVFIFAKAGRPVYQKVLR